MNMTKNKYRVILATAFAVSTLLTATPAFATDYVVFVHGKGADSSGLSVTDGSRWGKTDSYGAANKMRNPRAKRFVNYDGRYSPTTTGTTRAQTKLTSAINSYCSGSNSCIMVCHSAGCYAIGYWIAHNTAPSGLTSIVAAGSADGGSRVADMVVAGSLAATIMNPLFALLGWAVTGEPNNMTYSLRLGTARGAYNHNYNDGKTFRHVAGYKSPFGLNVIIEGNDDGLVNFSSACGYSSNGTMTHCSDGNNAKYTGHVAYCNSKGAITCNTSNYGYNANHSEVQPVGRDAVDRLLGYL